MKTVIELAKEAGGTEMPPYDYGARSDRLIMRHDVLERFATLVRAERQWVDLTDDEIGDAWEQCGGTLRVFWDIASAAFKEKNK